MELEFKGSPAPWQVEYLGLDANKEIIEWITCKNGGANIVCLPPEHEYASREFWDANANLIAAAPELLAFAIDFVEKVESGRAKSTDSYNKAKLAINKALNGK